MSNIKLVGSNIRKLSAFRNQNFSGKVSLETNIKLLSMDRVDEAKDTIRVAYSFEVDYKELGNIFIEGNLFVSAPSKNIKDLLKSWKDKKFEGEDHVIITNLVIQKASLKCFALEDEFGLPTHIKLPSVNANKK